MGPAVTGWHTRCDVAARMRSLRPLATLLGLVALLSAAPARAQECARDIDDTGRLVESLKDLLGTRGRSLKDALGGILDPEKLAADAASASPRERSRLAGELLSVLSDARRINKTECEDRRVRYNAAALLVQLVKQSPKAERAKFFDCLIEAARNEPDPALRRQLLRDIDRLKGSGTAQARKAAAALTEEILPKRPNYASLFGENGERTDVNVRIHTAAEIFTGSTYIGTLRRAGAKVERHGPHDVTMHWTVTPDDPTGKLKPVTYHIRMTDDFKDDWANFDVFSDMDDASPQIEVYDFHSQYGNGLDGSFDKAPNAKDAEKLYILAACKSKVFASKAAELFPKTHFVTTKDGEYFSDTPHMFVGMLRELANRSTYAQINRRLAAEDLTNYHFPNDDAQLEYVDADNDGTADATDEKLDCGLLAPANKGEFVARDPAAGHLELSGAKVLRAVTVANGLVGYNLDIGPRWEDKFVSKGFAPADPEGPVAVITPTKDARGRKAYDVRVNAAYSHLNDTALAAALTHELSAYAGANGRLANATREDKIRAYETAVDLLSAWDYDGALYDGFQAKYNDFGKSIPFSYAVNALDKHDGATAATIAKVGRYLDR